MVQRKGKHETVNFDTKEFFITRLIVIGTPSSSQDPISRIDAVVTDIFLEEIYSFEIIGG